MPALHKYRPHHLALAIALTIGSAEASIEQLPDVQVSAQISEDKTAKPRKKKTPTPKVDPDDLFAIKEFIGPLEHTSPSPTQASDAPSVDAVRATVAIEDFSPAFYEGLEFPEFVVVETGDEEFDLVDPFERDMLAITTQRSFVSSPLENIDGVSLQLGDGDDLLVINKGARWDGRLDGGKGANGLLFNAVEGGEIGETRNFSAMRIARGQWTLRHAFEGDADVKADAVLLNYASINGVDVDPGAVFGGYGHVTGLYVAGTLLASQQHGSPNIKGNLTLHEDAVFSYAVSADRGSDPVHVQGTASLGGARVEIYGVPGDYARTNEYRLLSANVINGEFGEVTTNLAYMTPTLSYEPNAVNLHYVRNDVGFEQLARTRSARSIAQSLDNRGASTRAFDIGTNRAVAALLTSDKTTAPIALDQLAAGSNANLAKATLSSITPVSTSMLSAMRQLDNRSGSTDGSRSSPRQAAGSEDSGRVWIQALGHGGKVDRDADGILQHATQGLVVGADWRLDEHWHVGLLGGKSQTKFDARQYDGDLDSWHLGAYAMRQDGPLSLRLGATYASHDGSSTRRVAFKGFSDRLKGNYDAHTQQAFAEVGFNLGRDSVTLEPYASLGYQRYQRDSYNEKGGDAALKVFGQTRDNFSSTFGLRLAQINTLDNGMHLTPRLSAGWKHTFGEVDSDTRQQLRKGGKRFEVTGATLDRNSLAVDAGLDLGLSAAHTLGVGLTGELGNDSRTYGVAGQWRMAF
ncbi:autotransporter domain-containing protein [Pseudomonas atacamensis]|uniref:autotransporter outer membrane beta-barrel domain-containing protein n=1 Tax=Pseudomonas atacamensis TaxID=2565368 RepID=UPI001F148BDD|nr:autotransporter outer membrane beta-barrel domain-containing protein [Pseudomonas atacamensis]UVL99661.1 autotransporter domain-containing protein [Pseudomonas atacamensis]